MGLTLYFPKASLQHQHKILETANWRKENYDLVIRLVNKNV